MNDVTNEHSAWIGRDYSDGIGGQKIVLVGWSHWGKPDTDFSTIGCIERVISGDWKIRFFTQIRNYFGYSSHAEFWPKVAFFNFLPTLVGDGACRFGNGTMPQRHAGQRRFLRLIGEMRPDKTFIFTSRRWAFPEIQNPEPLGSALYDFCETKYSVDGWSASNFFLRHPQGANSDEMRRVIESIMAIPN